MAVPVKLQPAKEYVAVAPEIWPLPLKRPEKTAFAVPSGPVQVSPNVDAWAVKFEPVCEIANPPDITQLVATVELLTFADHFQPPERSAALGPVELPPHEARTASAVATAPTDALRLHRLTLPRSEIPGPMAAIQFRARLAIWRAGLAKASSGSRLPQR